MDASRRGRARPGEQDINLQKPPLKHARAQPSPVRRVMGSCRCHSPQHAQDAWTTSPRPFDLPSLLGDHLYHQLEHHFAPSTPSCHPRALRPSGKRPGRAFWDTFPSPPYFHKDSYPYFDLLARAASRQSHPSSSIHQLHPLLPPSGSKGDHHWLLACARLFSLSFNSPFCQDRAGILPVRAALPSRPFPEAPASPYPPQRQWSDLPSHWQDDYDNETAPWSGLALPHRSSRYGSG